MKWLNKEVMTSVLGISSMVGMVAMVWLLRDFEVVLRLFLEVSLLSALAAGLIWLLLYLNERQHIKLMTSVIDDGLFRGQESDDW